MVPERRHNFISCPVCTWRSAPQPSATRYVRHQTFIRLERNFCRRRWQNTSARMVSIGRACSHYWGGGAGSQFFRVQGVRSDAYRVSASDDRRGNRENWPRPEGLRRKSVHTSFSPLTVDPPQPSGSASSGPIFARNAIHLGSMNRPYYPASEPHESDRDQ